MKQVEQHTIDIINKIAGQVIMMEDDDIQVLGEILKEVNNLEEDAIQEYIDQVAQIVERLILDEYESTEVGIEELNAAVEQMQIALQSEEHVTKDDQVSKSKITKESDEASQKTPEKDEQTTEIILEEDRSSSGQNTATNENVADKNKSTQKQQNKLENTDIDIDELEEDLEEIDSIFEQKDDPRVINKVLKEDADLIQGFIQETRENLQMIENGMIQLESAPDNKSLIDEIFRPFHTIKGVAGFLNLNDINALSHSFENLLDDARQGAILFDEQISQVVFEGIDALRVMINTLSQSHSDGRYIPHGLDLDRFAGLIKKARAGELSLSATTKHKPDYENQQEETDGGKTVKNMGGSQGFDNIESSVRVSTDKMDSLLDLVGELVVTQNMVMQNNEIQNSGNKRLQQDIGQLKRITSSLQDLSMSLRMVPVKGTFQKMHRIVRDLARKKGKKIALEIHGEETEIDRNMVDELYEPLVHMIRNNCDHGIEMPEERVKAGKPETGKIVLNAYYKGGMVVIDVIDDGQGIDVEKIRQRAISRDLITAEDQLSESQILNLIFTSGFSTTEKVTDVSGRGVGMDVVKKAINNMRGSIDIKTRQGKGTSFSLKLPLTLAIIDGVVVKIGSEKFILPTTAIKESLKVEKEKYNKIAGKGETIFIRDRIVPLLRIDDFFNIDDAEKDPSKGVIMVVESENKEAAIIVDEMLDKQEIVIKSLGEGLNKIRGLSGGAIMPDGSVGLIIDVPTLLPKTKMSFEKAD